MGLFYFGSRDESIKIDNVMRKIPKHVNILPGNKGTIVLLHGFLASKRYWRKVANHLHDDGYQVVTIDLLGFGRAPKPKGISYGYGDHLTYIRDTLDVLNIHDPITIAGHSMGALLATRYAIHYPDGVKAVGLVNPPIYIDADQAYQTLLSTGLLYRFLLESRYRHVFWLLLRKLGPLSNHSRDSREGSLRNVIIGAALAYDLEVLQKPAVLLIGENDRAVYRKNIMNMELSNNLDVYVEQSGHHAPITHHKAVAHRILSLV